MSRAQASASAVTVGSIPVSVGRLQPQYRAEFERALGWFRDHGHADPVTAAREAIVQRYPDAYTSTPLPDPKGNWFRNMIEACRIHYGNARAKHERWRYERENHRRSHRAA